MAEPARNLPPEDQSDITPEFNRNRLRALEGGGEGDGVPQGNLSAVPDEEEALYNEGGDQEKSENNKEAVAAGLGSAASMAAVGGENPANFLSKAGKFFWASENRRRTAVGGGVAGILVGGGFLGLSFLSGPFQFIHIAQLISSHGTIASQNDATDERMGKMYRFLRAGGDPGETRLGHLSSSLKTKMLADLESIGLKPDYGSFTTYQGFTIDTTNPDSPYYKMNEQEIRDRLASKGITTGITAEGGKVTVSADGYIAKKTSLRAMVSDMHESKIPSALRVRILAKYGFVTWHPLKILDAQLNSKVYDIWDQAREKRLQTGETAPAEVDTRNAGLEETAKDANGKDVTTTTSANGDVTIPTSEDLKAKLGTFSDSGAVKLAGGAAAIAGVLCTMRAVDQHIGLIKYVNDIMPLMRMGFDAVTVGHQIMAGEDVDTNELSKLSKQFFDESKKGTSDASWANAQTFQADSNEPLTGTDMNSGVKETLQSRGSPIWLSWVEDTPGIGGLCSGIGQGITTVASVVIGIFSGGTISTAVGFAASFLGGPLVMDKLSHLLAGDAVNVLAQGAEWGNDINYGAIYDGNAMAVQSGGTKLSDTAVSELDAQHSAGYQAGFASESVADRLLNAGDSRSLLSHVIDQQNPNVPQNVASLFGSFSRLGSSLIHIPAVLLGGIAHADSTTTYPYPIAQYGFSPADMDKVGDPYANADKAAATLNIPCTQVINGKTVEVHPCGQDYIDKALKCFNVTINGGPSNWDVIPGASDNATTFNFYDPNNYNPDDCAHPGNLDATSWLQMRFFILDTGVMEGYACQQGDDQSCANDGLNGTSASGATTVGNYQNPLRDVKNLVPMRIDEGVDYGGDGPVYAIGNAKVTYVNTGSGWPGPGSTPQHQTPGTFIGYTLSDGLAAGKTVYVAENCTDVKVKVGDTVNTSTVLCTMHNEFPYIETGWAQQGVDLAMAQSVYHEGDVTAFGVNFSQLMKKLGAPEGNSDASSAIGALPAGWPTW